MDAARNQTATRTSAQIPNVQDEKYASIRSIRVQSAHQRNIYIFNKYTQRLKGREEEQPIVVKSVDRKLKKRPTVALPRLRSYEDKGGSGLTSLSASQLSKVQSWLEANNLNALKLTIFDVLTAPNDSEQDDDEELQAILSQLAETSLYNEVSNTIDFAPKRNKTKNTWSLVQYLCCYEQKTYISHLFFFLDMISRSRIILITKRKLSRERSKREMIKKE